MKKEVVVVFLFAFICVRCIFANGLVGILFIL
jgi:hypothetical protein